MSRARVVFLVFLGVSLPACGSVTPGGRPPDGYPIIQPGASGEPSRVIGVNEAIDLAHGRFTPADGRFMQEMIGHHAQAIQMTQLLTSRTMREDMKLLARRIELSQADEIKAMRRWLGARGQAIPAGHIHALMPGMLTTEEMDRQGRVSMFDFTDSAHPTEVAFFDRGPIDPKQPVAGGHGSAYWYNGYIYASELARGFDVLRLRPSAYLSQHEIAAATLVRGNVLNVQAQSRVTWRPSVAVAGAYLDQLARTKGISAARASAARSAMDRTDTSRLNAVATELDSDALSAKRVDAARLRSLAATLRARARQLSRG